MQYEQFVTTITGMDWQTFADLLKSRLFIISFTGKCGQHFETYLWEAMCCLIFTLDILSWYQNIYATETCLFCKQNIQM